MIASLITMDKVRPRLILALLVINVQILLKLKQDHVPLLKIGLVLVPLIIMELQVLHHRFHLVSHVILVTNKLKVLISIATRRTSRLLALVKQITLELQAPQMLLESELELEHALLVVVVKMGRKRIH